MEKTTKKFLLSVGAGSLVLYFVSPITALAAGWEDYIPSDLKTRTLKDFIKNGLQVALIVAGVVALIYIIIGGYQYITAGGNVEQAQAARITILNAIIGLVIVFSSYAILSWVIARFVT